MRIWITRTLPEADATARRLAARGHAPIVAPVLEARAVASVRLDLAGVDAIAFTSGHAIAAFAGLTRARDLPVFTVGDATAALARAAGFSDVHSADGNAETLAELIAREQRDGQRVLHPTAREPAADLTGLLGARGVSATPLTVYETLATALAAPPADADAVLIHSARAAARVAVLVEDANRLDLEAYAISPAAARPLSRLGLARLEAAPFPNESALLELLR
ncbi:MAG TPA: uroporphyrinogen-III synthase [Caulobacteraceae bacterium]|nr:uroporphyrinogen-III synthase [Caulobacteraceae bacterium]